MTRTMAIVLLGMWAAPAWANNGRSEAGYRDAKSAYNTACELALAGKKDEALQWLERAYAGGFNMENYIERDDDLRSLHGDPRFEALANRVLSPRWSQLEERYRALKASGESQPGSYEGVARDMLRAGDYREAARAFTSAAVRDESPAKSLYNAACARSLRGDKEAALALLQQAVEFGFSDPQHLDQDDDLDNIRNEPRFREIRELAVELDTPAFAGQARERTGRLLAEWRAALPRIEASTQRHPQIGQAWYNLGFAHLVLGRPDASAAAFARAASLSYRPATSTYNLACALAQAGRPDDAFAALDRAVALGFQNRDLLQRDSDLEPLRSDPRWRRY